MVRSVFAVAFAAVAAAIVRVAQNNEANDEDNDENFHFQFFLSSKRYVTHSRNVFELVT
jgi:hypothetical protein